MDDDIGVVAIPGSSGGNAVLVNYHQRGSRLTVVDNRLLVGDIDVSSFKSSRSIIISYL